MKRRNTANPGAPWAKLLHEKAKNRKSWSTPGQNCSMTERKTGNPGALRAKLLHDRTKYGKSWSTAGRIAP